MVHSGLRSGSELSDIPKDLRKRPLRVHDVIISGTTRTHKHVIEHHLRSARAAKTFDELQSALVEAQHELSALGIFKSVEIMADAGPTELPDTANIIVTVSDPSTFLSTCIGSHRQV